MNKTSLFFMKAGLYVTIASGSTIATFLAGSDEITFRSTLAVFFGALVAGANALKAFMSESGDSPKP